MSAIDSLLSVAAAYGNALGIEQSAVSWRALGDSKKLAAIEAGKDIQVRRFEKAMSWFSQNWPEGAEWPEGVRRPRVSSSSPEIAS